MVPVRLVLWCSFDRGAGLGAAAVTVSFCHGTLSLSVRHCCWGSLLRVDYWGPAPNDRLGRWLHSCCMHKNPDMEVSWLVASRGFMSGLQSTVQYGRGIVAMHVPVGPAPCQRLGRPSTVSNFYAWHRARAPPLPGVPIAHIHSADNACAHGSSCCTFF